MAPLARRELMKQGKLIGKDFAGRMQEVKVEYE